MDDKLLLDVTSAPCDIKIEHRESRPEFPKRALWVLAHVISGSVVVEQGSRTAVLGPGTLWICDMGQETGLHTSVNAHLSLISLPCDEPVVNTTLFGNTAIRAIAGGPGISNATASLLRTVTADLPQFSEDSIRTAHRSIGLLLHSALHDCRRGGDLWTDGQERNFVLNVLRFIRDNLADTELGPAMIARHFHISLRQLHRIFEGECRGVAHEILHQRIDHCARELRDPAQRHMKVSLIAARWGITDASKFSRQFRSVLGVSPREYRAGHGTG
ncbi:helix-turn-helix domain-containing protein [Streptomyces sp. NPDC101175]|uniref:helix-turn-helix domain-containing protein n=1 Tax=Streptomyces sp. NPDC101175 TaxID=3366123 RepID=UPI0038371739